MNADARAGAAGNGRPQSSDVTFEPAKESDVTAIAALLKTAELPHEDFARHVSHFVVARRGGEIVGAIGAEVYGDEALLRSLVVASEWRGRGMGEALLRELTAKAEGWGVRRWWLLTTTAETFFAQRGFRVTSRSDAPTTIAATGEFRGLCPSQAVCMSQLRRSA